MHYWGDDWPYWSDLNDAIHYTTRYMIRYGRIPANGKEKYGECRIYCHFGIENLYWFFKPNYHFYRYHKYVRRLDDATFGKLFKLLREPIYKWQKFIYRRAYQNAIKKWPHIQLEIINGCDYSELVKDLWPKNSPYEDNWEE